MPRNKLSKFDKELRAQISANLKKYTDGITQYELSEMTGIPVSTAFEGEDDIEDIEAFKATIKAAMIQAKKIAKKKYTPKKYRRD